MSARAMVIGAGLPLRRAPRFQTLSWAELADFLATLRCASCIWSATSSNCGTWRKAARWGQAQTRDRGPHALRRAGTVLSMCGNHDRRSAFLRPDVAGDEGAPPHIHVTATAVACCHHGDDSDGDHFAMSRRNWRLLYPHPHRNQLLNRVRRRFGQRYGRCRNSSSAAAAPPNAISRGFVQAVLEMHAGGPMALLRNIHRAA